MAFGNAHIKGAFGHRFGQQVHGATGEHGRRYAHNARIALCEFDQRVAKHILKFRRLPVLARFKTFALLAVELARGVPDDRVFLSQFIALALGGVDVEQARAGHVFEAAQRLHQLQHIVAVVRTEITDVHPLKDILLGGDERLERVVEADEPFAPRCVEPSPLLQFSSEAVAPAVVEGGGVDVVEVLLHAAHRMGDAHVVVVEDDEQVVGRVGSVVEPLKGQSAAHRPIADHRHHLALGMPLLQGGHTHAEGSRNGIGGVTAHKGVVGALLGRGKRANAAQLAVGAESIAPPCEDFVPIGLMSHVPNDAVLRRVEHIVERHGEFHHP